MPVLRAILHDRYTWEVHAIAVTFALLVLLFALIPGVTVIMVLPTALALAAVVVLTFWLHPVTYRNRGVADADRPDRSEPDRVGAVQVLDPRVAVAAASRNAMGIPACTPAAEPVYDNGGLLGGPRLIVNNTGRPIRSYSPEQIEAMRLAELKARKMLAPSKDDPFFLRGSPHYREATRILGGRARLIRNESIRQINGRYLKADQLVTGGNGLPVLSADRLSLKTESVRIRIPRESWLRKDFKHPTR